MPSLLFLGTATLLAMFSYGPSGAFAWGADGHEAVGYVAMDVRLPTVLSVMII